jgi:hypothetical protein
MGAFVVAAAIEAKVLFIPLKKNASAFSFPPCR